MDTANEIVKLLSGGLTPLIAIIAVYIAWQQHQTARGKLKLDLYDRRFKVYWGLVDLFAAVLENDNVPHAALGKYYAETREKRFLFDSDIVTFMDEVRKKVVTLRQINRKLDMLPES